ncbi:diguanylate cyclase [Deinococcus altitudinis]|uniref:GGDEF domain-containing protein n=1 Tax=Deinococcus altitudinis TaxID=468914 RepID=UPI003891AFA0
MGRAHRLLSRLWRLGFDGAWDARTVSNAQRGTFLLASVIGVPALLCLWLYVFFYRRDNFILLYFPLMLAGVLASLLVRSRGNRSISARRGQTVAWSTFLFALVCLVYRAAAPQHFDQGLSLLLALLMILAAIAVCIHFTPIRAGLTLALLEALHSLPLLSGMTHRALRGGPLLIELVTELTLTSVLLLLYGSSWMQLALGTSQATSAQLEQLSRTDHLTGLYNRRSLYVGIEALLAELTPDTGQSGTGQSGAGQGGTRRRSGDGGEQAAEAQTFSVVLLDIDHFKSVNDTFGHASGDTVLRAVAEVLQSFLRQRDLAGRWGGEEFVLVLPGVPLTQAGRIAERLRQRIESADVLKDCRVTASFGVTCWQPGDSLEAVMGRADSAMYRAKHLGRNRVELAELLPGQPVPS